MNSYLINKIRDKAISQKARKEFLAKQIRIKNDLLYGVKSDIVDAEQAVIIIQEVAESIQNEIKNNIQDLVNLSLKTVFDDPPNFIVNLEKRRNQIEIDLLFSDNFLDEGDDPLESNGGGLIDIASFALRLSVWSLTKKTNRIFVLDEPFRHLSSDLQKKASELVNFLSIKMNIQFIIISHQEEMEGKIFTIVKQNNTSTVKEN